MTLLKDRYFARPLLLFLLASVLVGLVGGCVSNSSGQNDDRIAPLLDGMGDHHHPITTDDSMAQRYFDQGLVLAWVFNHAEAGRSFREVARHDPDCAMCYWERPSSWGRTSVLGCSKRMSRKHVRASRRRKSTP